MINTKLQNIIDTKSAIGNAIVNKGGTITSETPFFNYAAQIDGISTGAGNYSTWVVQDENSAKYTIFNGFDSITNPTPNASNLIFNQWQLNNTATGDIVLSNTIMGTANYNGPNFISNIFVIPFVNNTANYGGAIYSVTTNNGFIYVGGTEPSFTQGEIKKYYESNLAFVNNSTNYGGIIYSVIINNGFIYAGGSGAVGVKKYHESNLVFNNNTASYGSAIFSLKINNGFIFAGGLSTNTVVKYGESNLANIGNSVSYGHFIYTLAINNGFIYVGGEGNASIRKYHEGNLVFHSNSVNYGASIKSIAINNGFVYAGGGSQSGVNRGVTKFHESNLALVGANLNASSTANYGVGDIIENITTSNGFLYVAGAGNATNNRDVKKYYESNLAFVANSNNYGGLITTIRANNGFLYVGGETNFTVQKFQQGGLDPEQLEYYKIDRVKE
jgi:predicted outer membrane repeat protein